MNIHLGDLEEYVQQKLARGGDGAAAEVIREALREMREREREDAIDRRLQSYVLRGIDQGPPEGVTEGEWNSCLAATRDRLRAAIQVGLDDLERGDVVDGDTSRARSMERIKARLGRRPA